MDIGLHNEVPVLLRQFTFLTDNPAQIVLRRWLQKLHPRQEQETKPSKQGVLQ